MDGVGKLMIDAADSDARPIGVFDSGVGGLTVLRAIHDCLPHESTTYVADLDYFPYGPKSRHAIRARVAVIARHLLSRNIKALVVACNTATSAALDIVVEQAPCPVLGVVHPGARAAVRASSSNIIGVVATEGTARSGAYTRAIHQLSPGATVVEFSSGNLVDLIETGQLKSPQIRETVSEAVNALLEHTCDTIILGCTHFPLVKDEFLRAAGDQVVILDSALATAEELRAVLNGGIVDSARSAKPIHEFLVTAHEESFVKQARTLFGEHIIADLITVDSSGRSQTPELVSRR